MNSKTEKLSYEDLIKALQCCANTIETNMCGECPAAKYKAGECDDLVKLQAAEMLKSQDEQIDNYIKILAKNTNLIVKLNVRLKKSRALNKEVRKNAVKDMAERLKETPLHFSVEHVTHWDKPPIRKMVPFIDDNDIDNIAKEIGG